HSKQSGVADDVASRHADSLQPGVDEVALGVADVVLPGEGGLIDAGALLEIALLHRPGVERHGRRAILGQRCLLRQFENAGKYTVPITAAIDGDLEIARSVIALAIADVRVQCAIRALRAEPARRIA